MANRNITVVSRRSQFKDYVSTNERLLICGITNSLFEKTARKPSSKKASDNDIWCRGNFCGSKTVLV